MRPDRGVLRDRLDGEAQAHAGDAGPGEGAAVLSGR